MRLLELFYRKKYFKYKKPLFSTIKCISTKNEITGNMTICSIEVGEQIVKMLKSFYLDEMKYTGKLVSDDIKNYIPLGTMYYISSKFRPNKVIGMIDIRSSMMTPNATEISMLYIDEKYRNKNYGTKLIDFAKMKAHENGKPTIVARVYECNQALTFYCKLGFDF